MSPRSASAFGGGLIQLTVRLTSEQFHFLQESGPGNFNENLRRSVEDARTLFDLPQPIREGLARDAQEMELDLAKPEHLRDYIIRVLTYRAMDRIR